jgi:hypothetical protein
LKYTIQDNVQNVRGLLVGVGRASCEQIGQNRSVQEITDNSEESFLGDVADMPARA